jgi:predicted GNAT family N-acyltransferase
VEDGGFRYEPLGSHHLPLRRRFRCGDETLDVYLRSKRAWQDQAQDLAAVWVLYDPTQNRIAGYYTLSGLYVQRHLLPEERREGKTRYEEYPATLLGRMARDLEYANQKIGERLLLDALKRALDASGVVASYAVVVDAGTPEVEGFYQYYGFERLETEQYERRYYLPMASIRQLFQR